MNQNQHGAGAAGAVMSQDQIPVEEASTLGFRPGEWPMSFRHEGTMYYRGVVHISDNADCDLIGYTYISLERGALKVLND